tara:strand:- start:145072 stop:145869 length:798 start_codon:yes stop_codon:yes gene_type:complete
MLLQEPQESPYDIRFSFFGFPVRVSWTFWLAAIVFGYNLVDGFDRGLNVASPGRAPLMLLWGLCMFMSILIHELGHAFAFRAYGIHSSIVLYHFGGLAIPSSTSMPGRSIGRMGQRADLMIALAGPAAQLASAALVVALVKMAGYQVLIFRQFPAGLDRIPGVLDGDPIDSAGLLSMVSFYIYPSVLWALLNLIPVWPLDGGRIARSLVMMGGGDANQSLWISLIAAGAMAAYGFQSHNVFLGILFLSLAVSNFQMLQHTGSGWR